MYTFVVPQESNYPHFTDAIFLSIFSGQHSLLPKFLFLILLFNYLSMSFLALLLYSSLMAPNDDFHDLWIFNSLVGPISSKLKHFYWFYYALFHLPGPFLIMWLFFCRNLFFIFSRTYMINILIFLNSKLT